MNSTSLCAHGKMLREPCVACQKLDRIEQNLRIELTNLRHEASRLRTLLEAARQAASLEEIRDLLGTSDPDVLVVPRVEGLTGRVLAAVSATFESAELAPLSHYQDHVQSRLATNIRRALSGGTDFISS